jgi:uncharacterized membrane protein
MRTFIHNLRHDGLHRPRLLAAAVAGLTVWLALPGHWTLATRVLIAWNAGVWPYLFSMAW